MATPKTKARRPATRKKTASKRTSGHGSLERLDESLDSAQKALGDLRKQLSSGGHDLVKDLQKRVGDTRRDARGLSKSLRAELEQLGGSISRRGRTTKKRAGTRKKATARKQATKKTTARKKATRKASAKR